MDKEILHEEDTKFSNQAIEQLIAGVKTDFEETEADFDVESFVTKLREELSGGEFDIHTELNRQKVHIIAKEVAVWAHQKFNVEPFTVQLAVAELLANEEENSKNKEVEISGSSIKDGAVELEITADGEGPIKLPENVDATQVNNVIDLKANEKLAEPTDKTSGRGMGMVANQSDSFTLQRDESRNQHKLRVVISEQAEEAA